MKEAMEQMRIVLASAVFLAYCTVAALRDDHARNVIAVVARQHVLVQLRCCVRIYESLSLLQRKHSRLLYALQLLKFVEFKTPSSTEKTAAVEHA